jgi:hypothetical protein
MISEDPILEQNTMDVQLPVLESMQARWKEVFGVGNRCYYYFDILIKEMQNERDILSLPQEDEMP